MTAYDGLISDMRQALPLQKNEKRVFLVLFFLKKTKARKKSYEQELGHKTTLSDSIVLIPIVGDEIKRRRRMVVGF